ncbi:MAG: hypothetical protein PVI33_03330, partial [Candidatus Omnitrophota bacterium]
MNAQDSQKEMRVMVKRMSVFIPVLLIIILGAITYSNSLNGKFVLDDKGMIRDNQHIRSWSNLSGKLTRDLQPDAVMEDYNYRPLAVATYTLDYSLWGLDTKGYHLTSILLHILVAISVYWLIRLLFQDN